MIETALRHTLMGALAFRWPWTTPKSSAAVRARQSHAWVVQSAPESKPAAGEHSALNRTDRAEDKGQGTFSRPENEPTTPAFRGDRVSV
jgi:hypothetical protein